MEKINDFSTRENGRVAGGLILVVVGVTLLLRKMGFYMPGWLFSWPMILILVGLYTGFKHSFRNKSWLILIAIGGFFLVSRFIPDLNLEPLFWPLLIIGMGIVFIVRPGKNSWGNFKTDRWYDKGQNESTGITSDTNDASFTDSADYLQVRSVFSGVKKHIVSKNFQGGTISAVFGGAEIDLSQAEINGQVIIKMEILFGGSKLVVPPHWAVQNEIDGVFHGVDDKRRFNPNAAINPGKVLILKGSATFGGIEIVSY